MSSPRSTPPTIRQVAHQAGVSPSTVSLSLRNHPSIPESTRARVRKVAEGMGYQRDPVVASLMTRLPRARRGGYPVLGLITDLPPETSSHYDLSSWAGARERAAELGYQVEVFHLSQMPAPQLNKVLVTRGIEGLLVGPMRNPNIIRK